MTHIPPQDRCVLAIAPSTVGFGFVVMEGRGTLVDWGVKTVKGNKNAKSLVKVKTLIAKYQPRTLILENTSAKASRRSPRIRRLTKQIVILTTNLKVNTKLFPRDQVMKTIISDGIRTRHQLAEILAKRFPDQLAMELPPKRKPWKPEDPRMSIFDAVSLAVMFWPKLIKQSADKAVV